MIEVFKTTVTAHERAMMICEMISLAIPGHVANFDLEDCDHILRVKSAGSIDYSKIQRIVQATGAKAEVLPDEVPKAVLPTTSPETGILM